MSYIAIGANQVPPGKYFKPTGPTTEQKLKPNVASEWVTVLDEIEPLLISNLFINKKTTHDYRYAVRITVDGNEWPIIEGGGEGVKITDIIDQSITTATNDLPLAGPMYFPDGVKIEMLSDWDVIISTYAELDITYIPGTLTDVQPPTDPSVIVEEIGDVVVSNKTFQPTEPGNVFDAGVEVINEWKTVIDTTDPISISKFALMARGGHTTEARITVEGEVWPSMSVSTGSSTSLWKYFLGDSSGSSPFTFQKGIKVEVKGTRNSTSYCRYQLVAIKGQMRSIDLDPELINPPAPGTGVQIGGTMMSIVRKPDFMIKDERFIVAGHVITDPDDLSTIDQSLHELGVAYENYSTNGGPTLAATCKVVVSDTGTIIVVPQAQSKNLYRYDNQLKQWVTYNNVFGSSIYIYDLDTDGKGNWVVATRTAIYTSNNDGLTWVSRGRGSGTSTSGYIHNVKYDRHNDSWMLMTQGYNSNSDGCIIYSDDGLSFTNVGQSIYGSNNQFLVPPSGEGKPWYAVFNTGSSAVFYLKRSVDKGRRWDVITVDGTEGWTADAAPYGCYTLGDYFYLVIPNVKASSSSVISVLKYHKDGTAPSEVREFNREDYPGLSNLGQGIPFNGGVYFRNGLATFDGFNFIKLQYKRSVSSHDANLYSKYMYANSTDLFANFDTELSNSPIKKTIPSVGTKIPYAEGSASQIVRIS